MNIIIQILLGKKPIIETLAKDYQSKTQDTTIELPNVELNQLIDDGKHGELIYSTESIRNQDQPSTVVFEKEPKIPDLYQEIPSTEAPIEESVISNLIKLAEDGDPKAMNKLGIIYHYADKINEAKKWFMRASAKGNTESMMKLGEIYEEEGYIPFANIWYSKAAELKNKNINNSEGE